MVAPLEARLYTVQLHGGFGIVLNRLRQPATPEKVSVEAQQKANSKAAFSEWEIDGQASGVFPSLPKPLQYGMLMES